MYWAALILAGIFEIGWPLGLKISQSTEHVVKGLVLAVVCMVLSGALLWYSQKQITIGTAYAVWTGIGAAGTFMVGVYFFGDPTSLLRYCGVLFILLGVVLLKMAA
tara:strand:+ start:1309 stop:1626 length:318 start_codon:yes stop_codon:yes gene_type:complete